MQHNRDDAGERLDRIDAQLAGLVGIVSALIAAIPAERQEELLSKIDHELERLHAVILADSGPHSEGAIKGIEGLKQVILGTRAGR